jgi:hypothetical protein
MVAPGLFACSYHRQAMGTSMSENIESNSALVKSESNFGAGEQPVSESNADYAACLSALTYDDRRQLEEIAQDIERIERKAILQIAAKLAKARDVFRYRRAEGGFTGWITKRLRHSSATACNVLNIYQRFGGDECFQTLEILPISALYLLAAPSTPDEAVKEIADRVKAGKQPSCAEVKETIERAKRKKNGAVEPGKFGSNGDTDPEESAEARKALYAANDAGRRDEGGEDSVDRADMPADGENGEPPDTSSTTNKTSSTTNERAASATDGKAEAGEPSLLDRWKEATPEQQRDDLKRMLEGVELQDLIDVLPVHLRRGLEGRLIARHGLQCSDKLTKILRTIVRSRSPAEQITAVAKFNQVLAANNLDLGKVHVRVPKNSG